MKILIEHGCFRGPPVQTTSQSIATLQSLFYPIFCTLKTEYFRKLPSSCLGNIPTEITTDSRLHQYFFFAMMQKKSNFTPLMRYSGIIARKDSVDKRKEKFL